jgi:hypothetical protein
MGADFILDRSCHPKQVLGTLVARLDRLDAWAEAFDRRLAELDDKINRVLERLPDPAGQAERDGPVEPFAFRFHGKLYEGFQAGEWKKGVATRRRGDGNGRRKGTTDRGGTSSGSSPPSKSSTPPSPMRTP